MAGSAAGTRVMPRHVDKSNERQRDEDHAGDPLPAAKCLPKAIRRRDRAENDGHERAEFRACRCPTKFFSGSSSGSSRIWTGRKTRCACPSKNMPASKRYCPSHSPAEYERMTAEFEDFTPMASLRLLKRSAKIHPPLKTK
jgi:hypothetical protein